MSVIVIYIARAEQVTPETRRATIAFNCGDLLDSS